MDVRVVGGGAGVGSGIFGMLVAPGDIECEKEMRKSKVD